jgi:hypothetical protein
VLVGVIALAAASMLSASGPGPSATSVAFAVPAADDNNDDPTGDDNNEERELQGQVIELHEDRNPPQALVATLGEDVWANLYNDQLHRSGVRQGDHVRMQGEYNKGVFDAYEIDVQDRCCPRNGNSGDGNDNG